MSEELTEKELSVCIESFEIWDGASLQCNFPADDEFEIWKQAWIAYKAWNTRHQAIEEEI